MITVSNLVVSRDGRELYRDASFLIHPGWKVGLTAFLLELGCEEIPAGYINPALEHGRKYLGDYLNGDTYYKIQREGQNLDRARTQIKMLAEMERLQDKMEALVRQCRVG